MTIPGPMRAEIEETLEEVEVIEEHFHTEQLCFGMGGDGYLENGSLTPFRLTTGAAGVFGVEQKIYNGALGVGVLFDLDKVFVTEIQRIDQTYLAEFWAGSGTFAAATRVSSIYFRTSSTTFESIPVQCKSPRVRADLQIWARVKCAYAGGTSWIDVLFESHTYPSASGDIVTS